MHEENWSSKVADPKATNYRKMMTQGREALLKSLEHGQYTPEVIWGHLKPILVKDPESLTKEHDKRAEAIIREVMEFAGDDPDAIIQHMIEATQPPSSAKVCRK